MPNIVYILADDLGYGDIQCLNPGSKIPTPSLDRLAREGMCFSDAHSGSAVCTPTRYGILTGRYCWRSRLKSGVLWGYSTALIPPTRLTVASLLKKRGYRTACVGKWHLGLNWETVDGYRYSDAADETGVHIDYSRPAGGGPTALGFDYFFGIPASLDMVPYVYIENDRVVEPPLGVTKGDKGMAFYRSGPCASGFHHEDVLSVLTHKAVAFIEDHVRRSDDPFFLYFPLSAPHTPILPAKAFQGKSGIGPYGDFVMQCDWTAGRIMEILDNLGQSENTLFIFTSDNGCSPSADFPSLHQQDHFPSYHFRGHKADIFEGGHRIPFLARWPGRIEADSRYDYTICLTDLMATVAALTGEILPEDAGEDSVNLLPALVGESRKTLRESTVHHSINGSFAIRQGKWKLEFCPGSGGWSDPVPEKARRMNLPEYQLYDLETDPGEKVNVQDRHPEVVDRLTRLLNEVVQDGRSTPGRPQTNEGEIRIQK